jgi:hypothetical protein
MVPVDQLSDVSKKHPYKTPAEMEAHVDAMLAASAQKREEISMRYSLHPMKVKSWSSLTVRWLQSYGLTLWPSVSAAESFECQLLGRAQLGCSWPCFLTTLFVEMCFVIGMHWIALA